MSETTTKVYARLTRDFPVGQQHRRAGITFTPGPRPVLAEVTEAELAQLNGDRYIEIVDEAEAQKWEERLAEEPLKTSSELEDEQTTQTGRNYGDEGGSGDEGEGEGEKALADYKVKELVEIAKAEGVEDAEQYAKPGTKKQVLIDAIEANRAAAGDEE